MDHRLIEWASRLPDEFKYRGGIKKYILKENMARPLVVSTCVWKTIFKILMRKPYGIWHEVILQKGINILPWICSGK
jgi:hypothetical protein